MKLKPYCTMLEKNEKVLLFNNRNMEIILVSSEKFYNGLTQVDMEELKKMGFIGGMGEDLYSLKEFFPDHISKAYLLLGTECNIACQYCTVRHNAEKYYYKDFMTEETLDNSLCFLFEKNCGLEHITLYGGEPFLCKTMLKRFFEYLKCIPTDKIPRIDIITNGIIFEQEIVEELLRWDVLVLVSLDGMETHHDTFRKDKQGNGTYKNVVTGINAYRNAGLRVGVSMVLGRHNYKDIRTICIELKQKYDIVSIGLTLPHMEPDVALDKEFDFYLQNHYDELLDVCQEHGLWFEQGMKRLLSLAEKKKYIYGCPSSAKGAMVRILPDGKITLCENMGMRGLYQIGNVNEQTLSMESLINEEAFGEWYQRCTNNYERCQECEAYSVCGMGCPYDAYLQRGAIENIEYRSCSISKQAIKWYLNRVLTMGVLSENVEALDIEERKRVLVECPW